MQNPETLICYLPACLNRSLSTILVMQFSFCRTNWLSGMLWINLLKRTLVCKPQSKQMVSVFTKLIPSYTCAVLHLGKSSSFVTVWTRYLQGGSRQITMEPKLLQA